MSDRIIHGIAITIITSLDHPRSIDAKPTKRGAIDEDDEPDSVVLRGRMGAFDPSADWHYIQCSKRFWFPYGRITRAYHDLPWRYAVTGAVKHRLVMPLQGFDDTIALLIEWWIEEQQKDKEMVGLWRGDRRG